MYYGLFETCAEFSSASPSLASAPPSSSCRSEYYQVKSNQIHRHDHRHQIKDNISTCPLSQPSVSLAKAVSSWQAWDKVRGPWERVVKMVKNCDKVRGPWDVGKERVELRTSVWEYEGIRVWESECMRVKERNWLVVNPDQFKNAKIVTWLIIDCTVGVGGSDQSENFSSLRLRPFARYIKFWAFVCWTPLFPWHGCDGQPAPTCLCTSGKVRSELDNSSKGIF